MCSNYGKTFYLLYFLKLLIPIECEWVLFQKTYKLCTYYFSEAKINEKNIRPQQIIQFFDDKWNKFTLYLIDI